MTKAQLRVRLNHPSRSFVSALLKMTAAEQNGVASEPLTLRESSATLTHIRNLIGYVQLDKQLSPSAAKGER